MDDSNEDEDRVEITMMRKTILVKTSIPLRISTFQHCTEPDLLEK